MADKHMIIDGIKVLIENEKNILELVAKAGIDLPTFCYHSELSMHGSCRMCIVEDENGKTFTSCTRKPEADMSIRTNTKRLRHYRKNILRMLLTTHCSECTSCSKSGSCRLQELAWRYGVDKIRFDGREVVNQQKYPIDTSSPALTRDPNKCIACGDCVRTCREVQGVGILGFAGRGFDIKVCAAFEQPLANTECTGCGQCAAVCPTGAIVAKTSTAELWDALDDSEVRVLAQVAPSVRVAIGEIFNLKPGTDAMPLIVASMRRLGFDGIYDTAYGADLNIIGEAEELVERKKSGGKLPMFSSCCPAWVRYVETKYPQLTAHLSKCKPPQGMTGAAVKEWWRRREEADPNKVPVKKNIMVSVMPCTAKKLEILRSEMQTNGEFDVDIVITTEELAAMIREAGIYFEEQLPDRTDEPFSGYSPAGLNFGTSGGAAKAVCHTADAILAAETELKGKNSIQWKATSISGLKHAEELLESIIAGKEHYDFVEVMACPGGCANGAGQPAAGRDVKDARRVALLNDTNSTVYENDGAAELYSKITQEKKRDLLLRKQI